MQDYPLIHNAYRLSDNAEQVIDRTTSSTKAAYMKRWQGWCIDSVDDLETKIKQVTEKWLAGKYLPSTVRQYKAVINLALAYAHTNQAKSYQYPEVSGLNEATPSKLQVLYEACAAIDEEGDRKELAKKARKLSQTSSNKAKRIKQSVFDAIMSLDDRGGRALLKQFFLVNTGVGLRPHEWEHAYLVTEKIANNPEFLRRADLPEVTTGHKGDYLLVKNAKNTHGRAYGEYRLISLSNLDIERKDVETLILLMREALGDGDFDTRVVTRLKNCLNYAKVNQEELKKAIDWEYQEYSRSWRKRHNGENPVKHNITIYSTRHQAVANAKAKLTPQEIAACFGHVSVNTASMYYGKRRYAKSGGGSVKPHPASLDKVMSMLSEAEKLDTRKIPVNVTDKQRNKTADKAPTPRLTR